MNRSHPVGVAFSPCSRYIAAGSEDRSVSGALSSAEALLGRGPGREKMKRAGDVGKGKREEEAPSPSPFPSSSARSIFSLPGPRPARRPNKASAEGRDEWRLRPGDQSARTSALVRVIQTRIVTVAREVLLDACAVVALKLLGRAAKI